MNAWSYTPKQIQAWTIFIAMRKKRDAATKLFIHALGASGEGKEINRTLTEWNKE